MRKFFIFLSLCLALISCGDSAEKAAIVTAEGNFCQIALKDRFAASLNLEMESIVVGEDAQQRIKQITILYTFLDPQGYRKADVFACAFDLEEGAKGGILALRQFGELMDKDHVDYTNQRVQTIFSRN